MKAPEAPPGSKTMARVESGHLGTCEGNYPSKDEVEAAGLPNRTETDGDKRGCEGQPKQQRYGIGNGVAERSTASRWGSTIRTTHCREGEAG